MATHDLGRATLGAWVLAVVPLAAVAVTAHAAESDTPPAWYEAVTVNGFLSTSYTYNFNRPPSQTNQLRVFDLDHDSLTLDAFELVVQRPANGPGEAGFRVDAVAGSTIPRVSAASGLFRDVDTGTAQDFDLQQATISYVAAIGRGLRIDVGKFTSHMGYEVIEGYDGFNDNASRSFLFGYAVPFTHTGLRFSYPFSDKISAQLHLVNGWDNARDNNAAKSLGAQVAVNLSPRLSLIVNGMIGPEQADNTGDMRSMLDAIAIWKASDLLSFGLNLDYGHEQNLPDAGHSAEWKGAAVYARIAFSPRFALCLRGEVFDDVDGVRTGTPQRLTEVTLTPELRLNAHAILRGDLRLDRSDQAVFEADDGPEERQPTASLNFIYAF
jgi:hypothetical protein